MAGFYRKPGCRMPVAVVAALLVPASLAMTANAGTVAGQCQAEAAYYGIAEEQIESYVQGCIMAAGGETAVEPDNTEANPETDAGAEPAAEPDPSGSSPDEYAGGDNEGMAAPTGE